MASPFFAVIDSTSYIGAVYGVGISPIAALTDAAEYGADLLAASVKIVPCSALAAQFVSEHGGSPSPAMIVTPRGVTMREEE